MTSFKPVTAALRVLDVLAIVNRLPQPSFARIRKESGLSSATVVRLLETLEAAGMIVKDADRSLYLPTSRTMTLSAGYQPSEHLGVVTKPMLDKLQHRIGWPAGLAILEQNAMVVVQTSRDDGPLFYDRKPGYRAPVLGTSLGLAFLAHNAAELTADLVARLSADPAPWNDLARTPDTLAALLAEVRSNGFAEMTPDYSREFYDSRVSAVGVPILIAGRAIAALNVMFLTSAVSSDQAGADLAPALRDTASQIASLLSHDQLDGNALA